MTFSWRFLATVLYDILIYISHDTELAHLIVPDFIIPVMFDEDYNYTAHYYGVFSTILSPSPSQFQNISSKYYETKKQNWWINKIFRNR
jgi:hypothetical protein